MAKRGNEPAGAYTRRFRRAGADRRLRDTVAALAEQLADQADELRRLEETIAAGAAPQAEGPAQGQRRSPWRWSQTGLGNVFHVTSLLAATAVSAIVGSVVLIGMYAWRHGGPTTFAAAAMAAAAAGVAGTFGGFLFGVPHYNAKDIAQQASDRHEAYIPSTNLEQVADWLTKILLGAGLVQLSGLYRGFGHLIAVIAGGFVTGNGHALAEAKLFTGGLLVFNFTLGFPLGYVVTTLWFVNKLGRPRRGA